MKSLHVLTVVAVGAVAAAPLNAQDAVYFGSRDGGLYRADAQTGNVQLISRSPLLQDLELRDIVLEGVPFLDESGTPKLLSRSEVYTLSEFGVSQDPILIAGGYERKNSEWLHRVESFSPGAFLISAIDGSNSLFAVLDVANERVFDVNTSAFTDSSWAIDATTYLPMENSFIAARVNGDSLDVGLIEKAMGADPTLVASAPLPDGNFGRAGVLLRLGSETLYLNTGFFEEEVGLQFRGLVFDYDGTSITNLREVPSTGVSLWATGETYVTLLGTNLRLNDSNGNQIGLQEFSTFGDFVIGGTTVARFDVGPVAFSADGETYTIVGSSLARDLSFRTTVAEYAAGNPYLDDGPRRGIGPSFNFAFGGGMELSPDGQQLYAFPSGPDRPVLLRVDVATGNRSELPLSPPDSLDSPVIHGVGPRVPLAGSAPASVPEYVGHLTDVLPLSGDRAIGADVNVDSKLDSGDLRTRQLRP